MKAKRASRFITAIALAAIAAGAHAHHTTLEQDLQTAKQHMRQCGFYKSVEVRAQQDRRLVSAALREGRKPDEVPYSQVGLRAVNQQGMTLTVPLHQLSDASSYTADGTLRKGGVVKLTCRKDAGNCLILLPQAGWPIVRASIEMPFPQNNPGCAGDNFTEAAAAIERIVGEHLRP